MRIIFLSPQLPSLTILIYLTPLVPLREGGKFISPLMAARRLPEFKIGLNHSFSFLFFLQNGGQSFH